MVILGWLLLAAILINPDRIGIIMLTLAGYKQ